MAESDKAEGKRPKPGDRLSRFLFWVFGPPTASSEAISAHSPQAQAYRERQRAARQQAREEQRKKQGEAQQ